MRKTMNHNVRSKANMNNLIAANADKGQVGGRFAHKMYTTCDFCQYNFWVKSKQIKSTTSL